MTSKQCDIYYLKSLKKDIDKEKFLFELKPLLKISDVLNDKHYLFMGTYLGIGLIIDKINKSGFKTLNDEEKSTLKVKYNLVNLEKNIGINTVLIKDFINSDDTILTIQKKIMTFINPLSIPNKQHLWIKSGKSTDVLGIEYNNGSKLILNGDIVQKTVRDDLKPVDFSYTFVDNRHVLLESYGNVNHIYYLNYDEFLVRYPSDLNDMITKIYFPFIRKTDISFDNYKQIIMNNMKLNNEYEAMFMSIEDKSLLNGCKMKNVALENTQFNINIKLLFDVFECNEKIPFIRFKDHTKEEFYKIYTKTIKHKTINRQFKNPKDYIIEYDVSRYSSSVSKRQFLKWTQKELTTKEKYLLKIEKEEDLLYERKNINEIIIKFLFNGFYYDINITSNKIIIRDLNGIEYDLIHYNKLKHEVDIILKKLNILSDIKMSVGNWKFITLDFSHNLVSKTKLSSINISSFLRSLRN